jgi:hypothetical protein
MSWRRNKTDDTAATYSGNNKPENLMLMSSHTKIKYVI